MTRKEFDARRGVERYENLSCLCNSREEEVSVLVALEDEGFIWRGTRDNPTAHHYDTPCYLIARNDRTMQHGSIDCFDILNGTILSVGGFND